MTNYHQILGIRPGATKEEVKRAYRKKAIELHPDRNKAADAHEQFVQITVAYESLMYELIFLKKMAPWKSPKEKYRDVREAPVDEQEFKEWYEVAKERSAEQARKRYREFEIHNDAFRRSKLFWVAKSFSIALMVFGFGIALFFCCIPFIYFLGDGIVILSIVFIPFGAGIFMFVLEFKKDFDRYFVD